jgi:hypothetical protein
MANTNRPLETRSPGDRFVLAAHPPCASRLAPAVLVFSGRGPVVRQCGEQGSDGPTYSGMQPTRVCSENLFCKVDDILRLRP